MKKHVLTTLILLLCGTTAQATDSESSPQPVTTQAGNTKEITMITAASSFPLFIVPSLDDAQAFYTSSFGFAVAFQNEWYLHLVSETGIQIGFMLPDQPTQPDVFHQPYNGNGVILSLEVEDADAAFASAQASGLDIILDLRSEEWGQRHFSVRDPNGVYVDVVQAIAPTAEYQESYATN